MLLVDDDKAQVPEGQEHGRTGTEDDVVRVARQLFLPDFYAFGIRILRVVDAQTVAEDALQTVHHLHRQRYLWQQVEHLLVTLQGPLDEVDVYLRLARTRHAVQQGDLLLHHRHQDFVVRPLLGRRQGLYQLRPVFAAVVQPSHLHLVGFQHLALLQLLDSIGRGTADVHQFLAGHLGYGRSRTIGACRPALGIYLVPMRQSQIVDENIQLLLGPRQHVEGDVQGCSIPILRRQPDVGLRLGVITVLSLQAGRQRSLVNVADGRHIIIADPPPQLQL